MDYMVTHSMAIISHRKVLFTYLGLVQFVSG